MVRWVLRWEAIYGQSKHVLDGIEAFNAVCRERGWVEYTVWLPVTGRANEFVLMADYPDLASAVAGRDAALADPEFMDAWRQAGEHLVQGSMTTEALEPVPHLA